MKRLSQWLLEDAEGFNGLDFGSTQALLELYAANQLDRSAWQAALLSRQPAVRGAAISLLSSEHPLWSELEEVVCGVLKHEASEQVLLAYASLLQRVEFEVVSDGSPVTLEMTGGANTQHLSLNGFSIAAPDGPGLAISDVQFDPATRTAEFTWNSQPGAVYKVEWSTDAATWIEIDDSYASGGETTTYADENIPADVARRLYRVSRN